MGDMTSKSVDSDNYTMPSEPPVTGNGQVSTVSNVPSNTDLPVTGDGTLITDEEPSADEEIKVFYEVW